MRAALVKGPTSSLYGAKCGLCPAKVRTGESVVWRSMPNSSYAEDRLVFHTDCMAALVDRAPIGAKPGGDVRAETARIRRAVRRTGDLFAVPA